MLKLPRWSMWIILFYAVGQLLHWYQLALIAKAAGAEIQIPKMRRNS